ncbi:MAG: TetR/AcrR family transcriptional regulator [Anaerolineales bacterium]
MKPITRTDTRRGQLSSGRVAEAAFELFVTQGYHGTSMRQIAEAAGLKPASIYNHFTSKEEIFRLILLERHPYHELLPILETAEGENTEELIRNVALRAFKSIRKRKELLHLLFIEIVEFDGKHLGEIFRTISPRVLKFLGRLPITKGELRPISKPNILMSMVGLVMSQWIIEAVFLKNIKLPGTKNHFDAALDIYLHGVLASKTRV